jgi:hypothetical protein
MTHQAFFGFLLKTALTILTFIPYLYTLMKLMLWACFLGMDHVPSFDIKLHHFNANKYATTEVATRLCKSNAIWKIHILHNGNIVMDRFKKDMRQASAHLDPPPLKALGPRALEGLSPPALEALGLLALEALAPSPLEALALPALEALRRLAEAERGIMTSLGASSCGATSVMPTRVCPGPPKWGASWASLGRGSATAPLRASTGSPAR